MIAEVCAFTFGAIFSSRLSRPVADNAATARAVQYSKKETK
jgi:hypothetical protein